MTETATAKRADPVYTTVTMDDGRVVEFAGTRKLNKEAIVTPDGKLQVRMDFVNGETRLFTLPESLLSKFALHGAEQKLGDEMAGLKDIDDCVLAIDELTERLNKGEWAMRRESSGLAGTSVLARALVEHSGKTPAQVKDFLSKKTQGEKVALRQNPAIAPIIARLEAGKEKKPSTIDTGAMLEELA